MQEVPEKVTIHYAMDEGRLYGRDLWQKSDTRVLRPYPFHPRFRG